MRNWAPLRLPAIRSFFPSAKRRWFTFGPADRPANSTQLYLEILQTFPSQREAQHFLQRLSGEKRSGGRSTPQMQDQWARSLLNPSRRLIALVVVPLTLSVAHQCQVAQTLVHLAQLGLFPVVLPRLPEDLSPKELVIPSKGLDLAQSLTLEFVNLVESQRGGYARPMLQGVFHSDEKSTVSPSPLTVRADLEPIISALKLQRIPVVPPILSRHTTTGIRLSYLSWRNALVTLARAMTSAEFVIPTLGQSDTVVHKDHSRADGSNYSFTPAEPCKLIVVTPDNEWLPECIVQTADLSRFNFINMQDEYPHLRNQLQTLANDDSEKSSISKPANSSPCSLSEARSIVPPISSTKGQGAKRTHQQERAGEAIAILDTVRDCLSVLPSTSSGIVVTPHTIRHTLRNWITDKPVSPGVPFQAGQNWTSEPSLPLDQASPLVASNKSTRPLPPPPTPASTLVLRHGLSISIHRSLQTVDLVKLQTLLESSFGRTLLSEDYWRRIRHIVDVVIVAGDYQGAAILTRETATESLSPKRTPLHHPMGGTAKSQWAAPYLDKFAISPQSQGMGIADMLWKNMCLTYPHEPWTWRSRYNNKVNPWYFDRSDGHVRIPQSPWVCFWSGQNGWQRVDDFIRISQQIPPSFA
ncbi:Amino-acid acetyltransferase, mitochondrial [Dispira parvispora]|uniref:Amino-acid acetyltransferase, mitochondrial n=1 Tax=Dispira parvispora TaxID=1520584 RepID=A0A9W8AVN1_9FUNG|nr:Amino-acid acetyltransferase, mitochondrial [Dispira parvispora]